MDYQDKTIWLTGASSGIGEALTYELNKQATQLILSSRNEKKLNEVKNKCAQPENIKVIPLDLEQYEDFDKVAADIISEVKKIDYLINNSGISQRSFVKDTDMTVHEKIMRINYLGTVALTKAVLPHMINQQKGKIVTVSSMVGKFGTPKRSSYAASKHALHGFMDSLRAEVYNDNIQVQIICPGYVNTNISRNAVTADGSKHGILDPSTAKGLTPEDFAQRMLKAILSNKAEVYICGLKERMGLYLKRFAPSLLNRVVRKVNVT
ncbi:MAG: SDR family oxidoreductase [Bacteroidota bacterium]